ncbi:MAG TPA: glycosyltransferase family 1 protein [Steroidobacteraceae bacterium]|nr:glycosyltransferase family 1 protein [Steroidobacteraceae bacterium]
MKIALITDAWRPQTNGVVTTLTCTLAGLRRLGHETLAITPEGFRTVGCPTYPEIRLALFAGRRVARELESFAPDAVHIATEGPLGQAGRAWCLRSGQPFTTSYHTQFPQYIRARFPIPERWTYAFLRRFHGRAARMMVSTEYMRRLLQARGFRNVVLWTRGVDTAVFRPLARDALPSPRPILLYAGRVAVEKNLEAFLGLDVPGTKYVVGGGPALETLKARYPAVIFTGYKYGDELARHLSAADAFVFPSRTDTFGIVLIEAMACGTPVAAFPVVGPIDVVKRNVSGCLNEDLRVAIEGALTVDREACRRYGQSFTWEHATQQFLANLAPRAAAAAGQAVPAAAE